MEAIDPRTYPDFQSLPASEWLQYRAVIGGFVQSTVEDDVQAAWTEASIENNVRTVVDYFDERINCSSASIDHLTRDFLQVEKAAELRLARMTYQLNESKRRQQRLCYMVVALVDVYQITLPVDQKMIHGLVGVIASQEAVSNVAARKSAVIDEVIALYERRRARTQTEVTAVA